jgi:hypothetical protein
LLPRSLSSPETLHRPFREIVASDSNEQERRSKFNNAEPSADRVIFSKGIITMDLQAFEQQQQSLVQKLSQQLREKQEQSEQEIKTREEALVEKEKQFQIACEQQRKEIENDEKVLEERIAQYNTMYQKLITVTPKKTSKINLRIGEAVFTTTIQNLTSDKESFFTGMFSEEFYHAPDDDGQYFIDRNPKYFSIILDHFRGYKVKSQIDKLSNDEKEMLRVEVDFYNVQSMFEFFDEMKKKKKKRKGMILMGGEDGSIQIWDLNLRTCLKTLIDHTSAVCSVIELSDGSIASGSPDNTIQI